MGEVLWQINDFHFILAELPFRLVELLERLFSTL